MESLKCFLVLFFAQVDWSNFASGNVWLCGKFLEYCASGGDRGGGDMKRKKGSWEGGVKVSTIFCLWKMGEIWSIVNSNVWKRFSTSFCVFLEAKCHQKETPLSHISQNQNYQDFLPPKPNSQAIGLANISKCDVLRVPGANNWTNTTVIEACHSCFRGAKGEACCEWMERKNMKSTTRRTHSVGNFQHFAEKTSAFWHFDQCQSQCHIFQIISDHGT